MMGHSLGKQAASPPQGGKHTQPLAWPVGPVLPLSLGVAILKEKTGQEFLRP